MKVTVNYEGRIFETDFSRPVDISIPLTDTDTNPLAWYIDKPVIEPVKMGSWTGKVSKGASTNFNTISFNPHGHGTHTECLGHITKEFYSINQALKKFFFTAQLISVTPIMQGGDYVITKQQLEVALGDKNAEAVIVRTLPNDTGKKSRNYSNTNPPYFSADAALYLKESGVMHLLTDLPSVDREKDEGRLEAHKAFWNVKDINNLNNDARLEATITEMVFIPDEVKDGEYLLNLQIASFENDASPSKPVLYYII